jgi:Flp pilus assembly protein TadG
MIRRLPKLFAKLKFFCHADDGAAMAETIIVAPLIVIFLAGILEFGAFMYAKLQVELGLRDAARYLARCPGVSYGCTEDIARNIAVYGTIVAGSAGDERVKGMTKAAINVVNDPSDTPDRSVDNSAGAYNGPATIQIIRVGTTFDYPGGTLLGLTGLPFLTVRAFHEERYLSW